MPWHKQKLHGTNKNCQGTNKNCHGTNKNFTTQKKTPRHKQKLSWRKSCFSPEFPEVDLSAMRGYPAISNMAETQFDNDFETGEYDAEQDSEESFIRYYFSEALSTKKSFRSY